MNAKYFLLLLGLLFACRPSNEGVNKGKRPNIIFIMTDDHAYQALSAYDSTLISTPNIDRIAREGMIFQNAFVTNSICSPSRAVALTGKFSHLNTVRDNLDTFDINQQTFPKILQSEGYETAIFGKWHLKSTPQGFDHWEVLPDQGHYYHPEFLTANGTIKTRGYVTNLITDKAINYLNQRDQDKPFLLIYNHKAPHRQWWPEIGDLEEFTQRDFAKPPTLHDDYEGRGRAANEAEMRIDEHMALSMDNKIHPDLVKKLSYTEFMNWYVPSYQQRFNRLSDTEKAAWSKFYHPINSAFEQMRLTGKELVEWKHNRYLQDYLGTIRSVDRNVGRLLNYLDENNLADNTIIIYTSDQGFYLGEHGWFDKRFMYEESFRTPLLIRYPDKVKPGSVNQDLVQNIDFAPTMLDVAGVDIPADMQGMSMTPLLKGADQEWRDELYYHYYEYPGIHMVKRHYGIRTDRYKLIHFYHDIDEWELYDLKADPNEMTNVYGDLAYGDIQNELHDRLENLRKYYKDSAALDLQYIETDEKRLRSLGWL